MRQLTTTIFLILGLSFTGYAQQKVIKDIKSVESLSVTEAQPNSYFKSVADIKLTPSFIVGGIEYPVPERNFYPQVLNHGGDINGDGLDDFYFTVIAADETTDDLTDVLIKSVVYFGTETGITEDNSVLMRRNLNFIEDLDGDGISEGYRLDGETLTLMKDESDGSLESFQENEILNTGFGGANVESYGDFDGDGYNDLIVYSISPNSTGDSYLYLIKGAESFADIDVDTLYHPAEGTRGSYRFLYSDLDSNDTTEIVQVYSVEEASSIGYVTIHQINEAGELETISQTELSFDILNDADDMLNGSVSVSDLNNNGNQELIIRAENKIHIFQLSETEGEFYNEDNLVSTVSGTDYELIGDYNNDDFEDLLIEEMDKTSFIAGDADLNLAATNIPVEFGEVITFSNNQRNKGSDINGDGIDDIIFEFSNEEVFGYSYFIGNADGSFIEDHLVHDASYYDADASRYTFNAGDFNGDGIEDYGVVYNELVEVFFGGSFGNRSSDLILSKDSLVIRAQVSGDFNGDGYSDIALNYVDLGIEIYFGSAQGESTSDYSILFESLYPDVTIGLPYFEALANAGDLNQDGADDLIFSTPADQTKSFVLFGGENISPDPDVEIPFFATNIVPAEDFNGDGVHDVALANALQSTVQFYSSVVDSLGVTFNTNPFLRITESSDASRSLSFFGITMASGDFNGDGDSDLIVSPYQHYEPSDNLDGIDAFYIYLGGTDADSVADHSFGIDLNIFANNELRSSIDGEITTLATSSIGELTTVPDQNGDGADEVLFGTTPGNYGTNGLTHAAIYYGDAEISNMGTDIDVLFEAPNPQLGLGANNNNLYSQNAHTAVGDFDDDGKNDFIFVQGNDQNYIRSPFYIYQSDQFSVAKKEEILSVLGYQLNQNYPNPFNPTTQISYTIPETGEVKLQVFDITGRLVSTLVNQKQTAGNYNFQFDASSLASGVYIYRLVSTGFTTTKKMTLIK